MDGKNAFAQSVQNDRRTYDNIRKTETGGGDDYTTGFPLHSVYFQSY